MGLGGQMHGILSDWCKNETTFNYNDYELLVSLNFPRLASKLEKTRLRNMPRNVLLGGGKSSRLVLGLDPTADDFKESAKTRFCTLQLVGD